MTAAEKLHRLIQALPEDQLAEVLHFAEFIHQRRPAIAQADEIPPGTLTGLRGMAKRSGVAASDRELKAEYTDYLAEKYL